MTDDEWKALDLKTSGKLEELRDRIKDTKEIVELLEDFHRAIGYYNQDIRNAIDILRMEQS